MAFDHSKKFMDKFAMDTYVATKSDIAQKYGKTARAIAITNREYQHRYDQLKDSRLMREPPSSGRIFEGHLVIRKLDTADEYETWLPSGALEECYELVVN